LRGLACVSQKSVLIQYKGFIREEPLRFDVLVEGCVLVEAKAVDKILSIHNAQLMSYMKLLDVPLGLLINFHEMKVTDGISRLILSRSKLMTTPERSLTGANRGNGDKNLCSLRSLLSNSGRGVVEIDFNHANSEGVNIYRRRAGDADFKFLAFGAEVGPRRARDTAPSLYNNPTIQHPMNR